MKTFFQRLAKVIAYALAGIVIVLAIAVGLFRLFLPRLPEYQEDIKGWASAAIGMDVEFSGMDARWGLSGPEVEFYNAELVSLDTRNRVVAAEQVSVGVGLVRLLVDRKLVVDRVVVSESSIEVRQLDDGRWWIQGSPLDELLPDRQAGRNGVGEFEIIGQGIELHLLQPGDERPRIFKVSRFVVSRDEQRLAISATVGLPEDLGQRLRLAATRLRRETAGSRWDVAVEIDALDLPGISQLHSATRAQFDSGGGDVDASLSFADGSIENATANVDFDEVRVGDAEPFSVDGLFEYRSDTEGWLLASNEYRLETTEGPWPNSALRIEAGTDGEGSIAMLDVQATYLRLDDFRVVYPWLSAERRDRIAAYDPDGEIRDLVISVSGLATGDRRFDVAADFDDAGFADQNGRPGLRGFSGTLRADSSGGRLEIDAPGMAVTAPGYLGDVMYFDTASGTLIWRRSDSRTTLLSDSIVLQSDDFAMKANVEVTLADGSRTPIVDLAAAWSVDDLSSAKRYIPYLEQRPNTSAWFQEGILAGRIRRGSARLYGPLDKWPFDDGEGRLLIEGHVEDARIRYLQRWPVAEVVEMDMVLENMRLYSTRNHIVSAGNEVFNAELELNDFRQPVFSLQTDSSGDVESIRRLVAESPLGTDVFGGRLEEIAVSGTGSFNLDLTVPIRNKEQLTFTAQLQTSNAGLRVEGFPAPVSDISGTVTIRHDDISSDSLRGTFLGHPATIELAKAPENLPAYRVFANASGTAAAESLIEELGIPLEGRLGGEAAYDARLMFPRGSVDEPQPFAVEVVTDLEGLALEMPVPLRKPAGTPLATAVRIELPAGAERIDSTGTVKELLNWNLSFEKIEDAWDLDRGTITFGGGGTDTTATNAPPAATRGLHLRGRTGTVRFHDWLDLSQSGARQGGIGERIRSIDMTIGNLHILGQHLVDHHLRVDRSARDWLVQIDGKDAVGSVFVPYDFESGRELVLDMERLVLPGDETGTADGAVDDVDPRTLPPISVSAAEFAIGQRFLGAVEADFRRSPAGLESDNIVAKDDTFDIAASARWITDEADPLGHRSSVTASVTSRDVKRTMDRLDYAPGIESDDLSMLLDLSWSGGPREDYLESLDGEVTVRIGSGQLAEVDPGAGRMFGLLSIAALPRRLALDFSDVFGKGFGFDKISGDFRIDDGQTYTCDLSLEGPAADIAIVGRAGLVERDYDQSAIVSASFGKTLPVVGGVLGGPAGAAAMLIFSQVFKKPLQEVSQVYYGVSGSWDEPLIDTTTPEQFAATAEAAGCIELEE